MFIWLAKESYQKASKMNIKYQPSNEWYPIVAQYASMLAPMIQAAACSR